VWEWERFSLEIGKIFPFAPRNFLRFSRSKCHAPGSKPHRLCPLRAYRVLRRADGLLGRVICAGFGEMSLVAQADLSK
jgi:hypothetical protein